MSITVNCICLHLLVGIYCIYKYQVIWTMGCFSCIVRKNWIIRNIKCVLLQSHVAAVVIWTTVSEITVYNVLQLYICSSRQIVFRSMLVIWKRNTRLQYQIIRLISLMIFPPNYANYIKLLFTSFQKLIDWIP